VSKIGVDASKQYRLLRSPKECAIKPIMQSVEFACPICKDPLQQHTDRYTCTRDGREYPLVLGIPDFRIEPYNVASARDRAITDRVLDAYSDRSFTELVALYEELLPTVSRGIRRRRQIHLGTGFVRAQTCLSEIRSYGPGMTYDGQFLEIGCGFGGFLIAAVQMFPCVVGLDLKMARLIVAKRSFDEAGCEAILICAAAEALPFRGDSFDVVAGSDMIEHVHEQARVLREAHRVLTPGGKLFLTTPNRWSLTPEPHVNVFGVGFLPKSWRCPYVWLVQKTGYTNISLLNWFEIRRLILASPFRRWRIIAPTLPAEHTARLPGWARAAAPIYHRIKEHLLLKWLVYLFGPLFHIICVKE
jgi:SAM-dependent methyltransferase